MTWLAKPPIARIFTGVAAAWLLTLPVAIPTAHANNWGEMAMVSETMGISDSRICIGEGSRGDLGCPTYAPTISPTGRINAAAGLTVDSVSLTTTGTTWGYLGSGASYLPNLASNVISATNISATTINGISIANLGGASPTNVPAFRATRNGVDQTVPTNTLTKLDLTVEDYDTYNNFDLSTDRFTPTVAGYYLLTAGVHCWGATGACYSTIYKNGSRIATAGNQAGGVDDIYPATVLVYMNGSTDYAETYGYSTATTIRGATFTTFFAGTLVASGNGLVSGTGATALSGLTDVTLASPATGQVLTYNGTNWVNATPSATTVISGTTSMVSGWPDALACTFTTPNIGLRILPLAYAGYPSDGLYYYRADDAGYFVGLRFNSSGSYNASEHFTTSTQPVASNCDGKSISTLYAEGRAFNFIGNSGAGGGALGDRLTSGTLAVTANSSTAIVSLSTNGTTWGYLGSSQSYLPNLTAAQVSATAISTTAVQIASSTTVTACTSTNAGTLRYNSSNTALELCTGSGWQVMGVGIPSGTISAFASTTCPTGWSEYTAARGRFLRGIDNGAGNDPDGTRAAGGIQLDALQEHVHSFDIATVTGSSGIYLNRVAQAQDGAGSFYRGALGAQTVGSGRVSTETRPKNVAVTFCQFNGTSNGWNNPLSGGSTVPGGSTGQIQYNTGGSFDASAGLTWDNANSRLTATNISATALTVNGVAITGSSSGDRITSGTTSMIANPSGTIEVNGGIQLMSATTAPVCTAETAGTIARINGKTFECRL